MLLLALLAAVVLVPRLALRDVRGLWDDEVYGYAVALGRGDLLDRAGQADQGPRLVPASFHDPASMQSVLECCLTKSTYPPLYYLLLHASIRLAPMKGSAVIPWLKLWNVVFAGLTCKVLYDVCKRAGVPFDATLIALGLWALSAWDLAVGLQLKAYGLGTLLTALAFSLSHTLRERPSPRLAVLYGLTLGAAFLTHYTLLALIPLGLLLLLGGRGKRPLGAIGLAWATAAVVAAAWLALLGPAWWQANHSVQPRSFRGAAGALESVLEAVRRNTLPVTLFRSESLTLSLVAGLVGLCAFGVLSAGTHRLGRAAGLFWFSALAAHAAAYFALRANEMLWPRYLVFYLPFFWLCVACASAALSEILAPYVGRGGRALRTATLGALLALAVVEFREYALAICDQNERFAVELDRVTDWRRLAAAVEPLISAETLVVQTPAGNTILGLACFREGPIRSTGWEPKTVERARELLKENRGRPVTLLYTWGAISDSSRVFMATLRDEGYQLAGSVVDRDGSAFRYKRPLRQGWPASPSTASALPVIKPACVTGGPTLCLLDRFKLSVSWRSPYEPGKTGVGTALPYSANTGMFWFFSEDNLEIMVKLLDGRQSNGHFWLFFGGLSDLEYTLTVTDTATGRRRSYHNPPKQLRSVADLKAFPQ